MSPIDGASDGADRPPAGENAHHVLPRGPLSNGTSLPPDHAGFLKTTGLPAAADLERPEYSRVPDADDTPRFAGTSHAADMPDNSTHLLEQPGAPPTTPEAAYVDYVARHASETIGRLITDTHKLIETAEALGLDAVVIQRVGLSHVQEMSDRTLTFVQDLLPRLRPGIDDTELMHSAVKSTSAIESLREDIEKLKTLLTQGSAESSSSSASDDEGRAAAERLISWIGAHIAEKLGDTSKDLWTLVRTLITPKEWTLKGELNATPFGLVKVAAEIKFGK